MPARSDARMASGVGGGVQGDDHRVAGGGPDGGDQAFQRLLPAADIDQHDVRPHALQAVEEIADIADVLVLDDDAERQIGETGLRLFPEFAVLDRQSDGQRIHDGSPGSRLTWPPASAARGAGAGVAGSARWRSRREPLGADCGTLGAWRRGSLAQPLFLQLISCSTGMV